MYNQSWRRLKYVAQNTRWPNGTGMFFLTHFAQLIIIRLHTGPSWSVAQPATPPSTQAHTALDGISLYSMVIPNIGEVTLYHHGLPS